MTIIADHAPALAPSLPQTILMRLYRDEPLFTAAGLFIAAMIVPTLAAHGLDARQFNGLNVWDKVLKFEFALSVWLLTLAFYARFLPSGFVNRLWYRVYSIAVVFAIGAELAWVGGAAANGIGSHFNVATPLMGTLYAMMGAFALLLTSASLVYGIAIRGNRSAGLPDTMKLAVWTSLVTTFVLTVLFAGYLSSAGGHWVGGTPSDTNGAFFFGWSRDGGDLRVGHFLSTHVLHVVPLAALAWLRITGNLSRTAVTTMLTLYVAFAGFTFVQALMGQPFLPGML